MSFDPRWTPTTILAAANLALLIFGGGAAYASLYATTEALRDTDSRHETTMEQMRQDASARESRLRSVELGAGRMETQLENIQAVLNRIDDRIEQVLTRGGPP